VRAIAPPEFSPWLACRQGVEPVPKDLFSEPFFFRFVEYSSPLIPGHSSASPPPFSFFAAGLCFFRFFFFTLYRSILRPEEILLRFLGVSCLRGNPGPLFSPFKPIVLPGFSRRIGPSELPSVKIPLKVPADDENIDLRTFSFRWSFFAAPIPAKVRCIFLAPPHEHHLFPNLSPDLVLPDALFLYS